VIDLPLREVGVGHARYRRQKIDAEEQPLDPLGLDSLLVLLSADEAIFHGVRDPDARVTVGDTGSALERVGGAHEALEPPAVAGVRLQRQEPFSHDGRLILRLDPKELGEREPAQIFRAAGGHDTPFRTL